jgi:hypothetical protein
MRRLARANEIRTQRAGWRRRLQERPKHDALALAAHLIVGPLPAWAQNWRVRLFLRSLPVIGERKSRMAMLVCRIAEGDTLGSLNEAQRQALAGWLEERAESRRAA